MASNVVVPLASNVHHPPGCVFSLDTTLNGKAHTISIFDCAPGGILIRARDSQGCEHLLSPSSEELNLAGISRTKAGYVKLVLSLGLSTVGTFTGLHSSLEGIRAAQPQRINPENYLQSTMTGSEALLPFLSRGLTELCKVKPVGIDAVEWLGKWLLANNPNQPQVDLEK